MKRIFLGVVAVILVLFSAVCVYADASDARQGWLDAKDATLAAREEHRNAKLDLAGDNSEENRQKVIDTGKEFQNMILNEAEAWLMWKKMEAEENDQVPEELKQRIYDDVEANMGKIDELREEVDGVTNQIQLGGMSLKMIGKYFELLTDVSRDSGLVWVYIGNTHADKIEEFEAKLRETAEGIDSNEDILEKLDNAKDELETARENIDKAEDTYELVQIGGTPFIKFREANMYLRAARQNMLSANANLRQAYRLIIS